MALTEEDKKYLSGDGIKEVQAATAAWDKAYSTGDKAGMANAAAAAAGARANTSYQVSGNTGYTTNDSGGYVGPVGQNNGSPQQRDIAAEIVGMLTQGGSIDYGKLNQLAGERDAKLKSNPSQYGQFETTQNILDRYLPIAKQNQALQGQLSSTQPGPPNEVDNVIKLLQGLVQKPLSPMSFEQAHQRASSELNPLYADASQSLQGMLNSDMEKRGIYNSPLASGILAEKQGKLNNEQIAAIAQRANTLIQNDTELSLQEKQIQSSTLNNLLGSLVNRETSQATLSGYLNGNPTLAREQHNNEVALKEGELTGRYQGSKTLASQQLDVTALSSQIANAINSIQTMGSVTTQEQADLLGVPIGTPSAQASQTAAKLQQDMEMFNRDMSLKQASLSMSRSGGGGGGGGGGPKGVSMANFTKDMAIWETTGIAPNTPALLSYGIQPGTPWTQSAKQQLDEIKAKMELEDAQEELNFQNRAKNFSSTYGINGSTSEAAVLLVDKYTGYNDAYKAMSSQKKALESEGVDINGLNQSLRSYYNVKDKVKPKKQPGYKDWGPK